MVIGASFIGLEVAASLRTRDIAVRCGGTRAVVPLERVMGVELGASSSRCTKTHGVVFHLGQTVTSIDGAP